jgi:hypothetical protein
VTRRHALALVALALAGCGTWQGVKSRLPPREPQPGPDDGTYAEVRDAVTRSARLYDGFVHRADVTVTWLSPEVRDAGTRRLAAWQGWTTAELDAALAAQQAEASKGELFFVSLYTADRKHNDLANQGSIWRIQLDDGAVQAPAAAVELVPLDANAVQLFPFIDHFDTAYRVRVPWTGAPLQGRPFALKILSSLGPLVLDFGPRGKQGDRPHQAP